ncbi:CynX/NimT family MFS transporter [Sporosarcina highlanderae]|uniref:MFS transporter n=1 Tax=Sporosarcina highlanderae TaxID=3035916 RepID=A0ABT8JRW3_9BACL|nr:MFS transporter [Sporosarcina highlanderae]MDN4607845.1 MFS transporter [Sporosarcina highlanderae]
MKFKKDIYHSKKLNFGKRTWLLIIGIIFIAATLRSPLTSVGPIIASIRDSLGISNVLAGFLTTIPLLAFALISPVVPKISRRFGMEVTLFFSLCLLTLGIVIRSTGSITFLIIGTFLIGVAIAFGNVLLPGLVKLSFPLQIGLMTGLYSAFMNISATIASGISVPITERTALGWQGSLGIWAILSVAALLLWLPQLKNNAAIESDGKPIVKAKSKSFWRSPIAWAVTIFMGLQSMLFYCTSAWLPEILVSTGMTAEKAGWMFSLLQLAQLPMTFLTPILVGKLKDQRSAVVGVAALFLIGYGGVLFGGTVLIPLWMIAIGISGGAAFGIAMMFFTLRTETHTDAANLSGMAQSFGYLLAAVGPVLFGFLHDATSSWTSSMYIFLAASLVLLASGMIAGQNKKIGY